MKVLMLKGKISPHIGKLVVESGKVPPQNGRVPKQEALVLTVNLEVSVWNQKVTQHNGILQPYIRKVAQKKEFHNDISVQFIDKTSLYLFIVWKLDPWPALKS